MDSFNHDNRADVIEAFNSTSRLLDDLLNIDNPYVEVMVNQIYQSELYVCNSQIINHDPEQYRHPTIKS